MATGDYKMAALAAEQLDLLPIGICVVDDKLNLLSWNQTLAQWTGISPETAIGSDLLVLYPHLESARFLQRIRSVFECGQPILFAPSAVSPFLPTSRFEDRDHSMLHKALVSPLGPEHDYAQIILTDVTAQYAQVQSLRHEKEHRRRSQEASESASRAKSEFLANMSHEIRTPMNAILGFNEILLEQLTRPEDIAAARTIRNNGEHLLDLINNILDLSKIEAGRIEVEDIECSLPHFITEVGSLMNVRAAAKGLPLKIEIDEPIPTRIKTDETRLRQILVNLLGNAIKFTEAGEVRLVTRVIDVESPEPKMVFDIIDSGIGMTKKQISKLFKPFAHADTSTTRQYGGTGLGLAICKRLSELLGGSISVTSNPNEGSVFSFSVSTGSLVGVNMVSDLMGAESPATTVVEANVRDIRLDCRVLLAEDGPDNQRLVAHFLTKAGAEVTLAENGKLALDFALQANDSESPYDVVLMDMRMPVMDGYEATRQLRDCGYQPPIIALTAHAMSSDRQKCLDAGCDDYATKPIDGKKLIQIVAKHAKKQAPAPTRQSSR